MTSNLTRRGEKSLVRKKEYTSEVETFSDGSNCVATFADGSKLTLPWSSKILAERKLATATTRRYKVQHLWTGSTAEHTAHILRRADRSPLLALFFDNKRVVNVRLQLFGGDQAGALKWLTGKAQQLIEGKITKEELDASKPKGTSKPLVAKKTVTKKPVGLEAPVGQKVLKRPAAEIEKKEKESADSSDEKKPSPPSSPKKACTKMKAGTKKKAGTKIQKIGSAVDDFMTDFSSSEG